MRLRARHIHLLETFVDNVVGLGINLALTIVIYNWIFGQAITIGQNFTAGAIFFFIAWARKYTIRRWSSNLIQHYLKEKP